MTKQQFAELSPGDEVIVLRMNKTDAFYNLVHTGAILRAIEEVSPATWSKKAAKDGYARGYFRMVDQPDQGTFFSTCARA